MSRADTLALEHVAGTLDADRLEAGLADEHRQRPGEVEQALVLLQIHALLRGEAVPRGLGERIMTAIRERDRRTVRDSVLSVIRTRPARRPRHLIWIAAAVAAALIIGVALGSLLLTSGPADRGPGGSESDIRIASGTVAAPARQLATTDSLPDHEAVSAGDAGATLRWRDGSEAAIGAHSRLHRHGSDLVLDAGQARFTVQPHPADAPFTVTTPHGTITVIGTVFTVDVGDATTCAVERGTVAFRTADATHRLGAGMALRATASTATTMPGWRLVWADEFAHPGPLDAERWVSWPRPSGINSDIQRYTDSNARIDGGGLVITARHEAAGWTSASLMARHLLLKPGSRIELRARMPDTPGAWPLLWAVQAARWPEGPEVVLLTSTGDPVRLRASTRFGPRFEPAVGPTVTPAYATYAITWTATGIVVNRDGVTVVTAPAPSDPAWAAACAAGLQLALELTVTAHDAAARSEQRLEVRYLRVYERGPAP